MEQKKLWSKMTGWLKPTARPMSADGAGSGGADGDGAGSDGAFEPGANVDGGSSAASPIFGGGISKRRRNEVSLERLQEGHTKVIELIDSIQQHQGRQDVRAEEISSSLSNVARTLSNIDGASQAQTDRLTQIAEALQTGNERAGRWEETLAELPELARAQRDSLAAVAQQMEDAGERDSRMSSSLDSFREAVISLSDATTSSSVAVKSLQMSTLENHELVATLMKEQNKRFVMLFAVTLALVVIAIVAGMVALLQN